MNSRITLCREHIVTVEFPNYKCRLMHTKETYPNTYFHEIHGNGLEDQRWLQQ
jgi:hypothetical protein